MELEGSVVVSDEDPRALTAGELQEMWDGWTGDLSKLREIYTGYLDKYKKEAPDDDPLTRANKAAARTILYKILLADWEDK